MVMPLDQGPTYIETIMGRFPVEPWNTASNLLFLVIILYWVWRLKGQIRAHRFIAGADHQLGRGYGLSRYALAQLMAVHGLCTNCAVGGGGIHVFLAPPGCQLVVGANVGPQAVRVCDGWKEFFRHARCDATLCRICSLRHFDLTANSPAP
jgi:hypothetical protein